MVNRRLIGGSRGAASSSFALSRSAAALAAFRSPAVAPPNNNASTFLNRSRSWSSIRMLSLPVRGGHRAFGRSIGGNTPSTGFAAENQPSYLPSGAAAAAANKESPISLAFRRSLRAKLGELKLELQQPGW
jgi:hypothetical protein